MSPKRQTISDPATETFKEVQRYIFKLINQFNKNYHNIDPDEVESAAYLGFVQAYHSFKDELNVPFLSWVKDKVTKRLLDVLRNHIKKRSKESVSFDINLHDTACPMPTFNVMEWAEGLPRKARKVVGLAIAPPIDIRLIMKQLGEESEGNFRQAIREFLKELNWSNKRIHRIFTQIRNNL